VPFCWQLCQDILRKKYNCINVSSPLIFLLCIFSSPFSFPFYLFSSPPVPEAMGRFGVFPENCVYRYSRMQILAYSEKIIYFWGFVGRKLSILLSNADANFIVLQTFSRTNNIRYIVPIVFHPRFINLPFPEILLNLDSTPPIGLPSRTRDCRLFNGFLLVFPVSL